MLLGVPDGIRTRVTAVKGRCPNRWTTGTRGLERNSGALLTLTTDGKTVKAWRTRFESVATNRCNLFSRSTPLGRWNSPRQDPAPNVSVLQQDKVVRHPGDIVRNHTREAFRLDVFDV